LIRIKVVADLFWRKIQSERKGSLTYFEGPTLLAKKNITMFCALTRLRVKTRTLGEYIKGMKGRIMR
jgi:hypothetical protein